MVTTTASPSDSRYNTAPGKGFDGVVRVSVDGFFGSGTLLFDGRAVLTAAHLFEGRSGSATVSFETSSGTQTVSASNAIIHPDYVGSQVNNDLALVWLSGSPPSAANRYNLYRDSDEIGQIFTMVGYGRTGTGSAGTTSSSNSTPTRLKAANQFDDDGLGLKTSLGTNMSFSPLAGSQLIADFDDGTTTHDALGRIINVNNTGLGLNEGLIAPGDSGGPAFLSGLLAGVASYTARLTSSSGTSPDIDSVINSSFGEIAAWQRVSHYQQWIDQTIRSRLPNAPTKPEEVQKTVVEGNSGTSYAYFLLQFTGVRSDAGKTLSVDYTTRDGTALANSDYISVHGKLNLYPGENQAVIPVEIIGDTAPEPTEMFYLDVTNPVGGSFGEGVVTLTAVRTILDNDGFMG
jgi:secreted trypsin-like serine protease